MKIVMFVMIMLLNVMSQTTAYKGMNQAGTIPDHQIACFDTSKIVCIGDDCTRAPVDTLSFTVVNVNEAWSCDAVTSSCYKLPFDPLPGNSINVKYKTAWVTLYSPEEMLRVNGWTNKSAYSIYGWVTRDKKLMIYGACIWK